MDDEHSHHRRRRRSRSPARESSRAQREDVKRSRSPRSPHHHRHHHHHHHHHREHHNRNEKAVAKPLPFAAHHLHRSDLQNYGALFAEYLDLQKQIDISRLSDEEVRGRWKSFRSKWNDGELAEGWYHPETKEKAEERAPPGGGLAGRTEDGSGQPEGKKSREPDSQGAKNEGGSRIDYDEGDDDDDDIGPTPLDTTANSTTHRGPTIPRFDDLQHRDELSNTEASDRRADIRYERKQDRLEQKERLDELAPRADPGSRERQLEKRRDAAAANNELRDARDGGAQEVAEGVLMGDEGGIEGFKARRRENERKKNEREIRKEEVLRARAAEREERLRVHRAKEEKTLDYLRAIAKQRFGGGGGDGAHADTGR